MEKLFQGCLGQQRGERPPSNGDLSFTGPECKWLPTALHAKIQIPSSGHTFFQPMGLQGPGGIRVSPHTSPGDGVNVVRSCGVASRAPGAGTAVLSPPLLARVARDSPSPPPWTTGQILKSDAFRHAYTWRLSRASRYCPQHGPTVRCGPSVAISTYPSIVTYPVVFYKKL